MRLSSGPAFRPSVLVVALLALVAVPGSAQTASVAALQPIAQSNRVPAQPNLAAQLQLTGHLPAWVRASNQLSSHAVDLAAPLHVTVLLRRDPTVQAAFEQVLAAQQDRSSPLYHQWLTPEQIGELYGPTAADVAAISHWLSAQGLRVDSIAPSRMMLEVSGSTAVVAAAFHTSFAYYNLAGTPRLSASSEPTIPAALGAVIDSIHGLTEIPLEPQSHGGRRPVPQPSAGNATPQLDANGGTHFLTPGDFDIIYDLNSVHNTNTGATIGSAAQHVAIIGRSRVAASDISTFEAKTGLPSVTPNVVIPTTGTDPGTTADGNQGEATLDVDRVIGTAYGAVPDLVISASSSTYDGIYIAASYEVNTLKDPIMTISFGACEANAGSSGVNLWNTLFATAAGEGISVFVSSGDSGAAGCDTSFTTAPSPQVASINYICSSSYATCVGGTQFNDTANPSTYWSSTNGSGLVSVLQYIPEGAWNEPNSTNSSGATVYDVASTGGGASVYIAKPSWQTGTGVPADGHRDVPDVSLSAAGHDGYYACLAYAGADCTTYFEYFEGTSAAAPGMAGIAALINTRLGAAQGNLNPLLYQIATNYPSAFHDTTIATSGVSGCTAATPSMCNNSTPSSTGLSGGQAGYTLTTGYDQATGLGSVDVANLITAAVITNSASYSITPASGSLTFASGATTGNTDGLTISSVGGFAGSVTLSCTVTAITGNTSGTCSLQPNSVALTSGSSGASTLSIVTPANTAGMLSVTVTGTSGNIVITSPAVQVTVTGPAFTAAPTPSSLTVATAATLSGNTANLQLTSTGGFAGTVTTTCSISGGNVTGGTPSCAPTPSSVALTSGGTGSTAFTVSAPAGSSGSSTLVLASNGTTTGGSVAYSVTTTVPVTFVAPSFTLSPASQSLSFTSGATTGNTNTITLASVNGFNGTVAVTCMISTGSAFYQPTCSPGAGSATVAPAANGCVTVTIGSTTAVTAGHSGTAQAGVGGPGNWRFGLASALMMMLCLLPLRRRRRWLPLAMLLLAAGLLPLSGCGKGGTASPAPVTHSSAGTYTVTVTGTGTTAGSSTPVSSTTTFTVTIN